MAGKKGMHATRELPGDGPTKVMPGAMRIGFPTWAEVAAAVKKVAKPNGYRPSGG